MPRQKRIIRFTDSLISDIQECLNLDETIKELQERYYDPEITAYVESQNDLASYVVRHLGKVLNLKGKPNIKQVEEEYDYYIGKSRYDVKGTIEVSVKLEYRRLEDI